MPYIVKSISILSGGGKKFSTEANLAFSRMTTKPSNADKTRIDILIKSLKSAGVFQLLDCFYLLAAPNDIQQATINLIKNAHDASIVNGGGLFTEKEGVTTNDNTKYINFNYTQNTQGVNYTLNNACAFIFNRLNVSSGAAYDIRSNEGTVTNIKCLINAKNLSNQTISHINNGADIIHSTTSIDCRGLIYTGRSASNAVVLYASKATEYTATTASDSMPVNPMLLGYTAGVPNGRQIAAVGFGAFLDATKRTALEAAIEAYLDYYGKGVL